MASLRGMLKANLTVERVIHTGPACHKRKCKMAEAMEQTTLRGATKASHAKLILFYLMLYCKIAPLIVKHTDPDQNLNVLTTLS